MAVGNVAYRQINRPDRALVERFRGVPTADLGDVTAKRGAFDRGILPLFAVRKPIAGPAITVSVPDGAFNVIKIGISFAQPGDVVVVNARGNTNHALLGGNVCRGMAHQGIEALIVDGAVRDGSEIEHDGVQVFARGSALIMGALEGAGEVNVPIACGNVVVNPGDIIVADQDGIIAIPPDSAEEILAAAATLHEKHQAVQPILLAGKVTNIDRILAAAAATGMSFHDEVFPLS